MSVNLQFKLMYEATNSSCKRSHIHKSRKNEKFVDNLMIPELFFVLMKSSVRRENPFAPINRWLL